MVPHETKELRSLYDQLVQIDWPTDLKAKTSPKNQRRTQELREEGGRCFRRGDFIEAVHKYNEALCYAESTHAELYANRATVLLHMQLPQECLESIRLAEENQGLGYPDDLRERLIWLTNMSEAMVKAQGPRESPFRLELTLPAKEKMPFAADCLQVVESEEFGRHIITTRALKVGDVVLVERPLISVVSPDAHYKRCAHCMTGDKRQALIPCPSCTNAMYCSEQCLKDAFHDYHRFECKVLGELPVIQNSYLPCALRSLFTGVSICGGLESYEQFLLEHEDERITTFDLDHTQRDRKRELLVLHNLHSQDDYLSETIRGKLINQVVVTVALLVRLDIFPPEDQVKDHVDFLLNTLYHHVLAMKLNTFRNSLWLPPQYDQKLSMSLGQYVGIALVNHSCAENVQRFLGDSESFLVVVRPIPEGGQLFLSYVRSFRQTPEALRQKFYQGHYGFQCRCVACVSHYPMVEGLSETEELPPLPDGPPINDLQLVRRHVRELCDYMQRNDPFYPCRELEDAYSELGKMLPLLLQRDLWEMKEALVSDHFWLNCK